MPATGRAIALTVNSASLRRAQLAFALIWMGEWAVMVTLGVVAFRDGGSAAVGVVTALRMLPAALLAPFAAVIADGDSAQTRQKFVWHLGRRSADPAQRLLRGGGARETHR